MKRLPLILVLILVFAATSAFAGGKSCELSKAKSVSLTGTIATDSEGHKIFRVADSTKTLTICHQTSSKILEQGANGATVQVKGKVVSCDEAEGEELVIESAKRV
jgi:phosphatidylserine decarboxylase